MSKLYVDELHPKTSGSAVKRPDLPAWRLGVTETSYTTTGKKDLPIDTSTTDLTANNANFMTGGITASGNVITVPVTGFYQCNFICRVDLVGSGYFQIHMAVNDGTARECTAIVDDPSGTYETLTISQVLYLEANDEIHYYTNVSADTSWHVENNSVISGAFLG